MYIDLAIERLLNPELIAPLSTDSFGGALGEVYWKMPASGHSIPDDAARQLEVVWAAHLKQIDGGKEEEDELVAEGRTDHRNPDWQRDELILALNLYLRYKPNSIGKKDPEVLRLSELLNALPIHANRTEGFKLRNANDVYKKLCDFLRFDSNSRRGVLAKGNRLEIEVWNQFAGNIPLVKKLADSIQAGYALPEVSQLPAEAESEEEEEFPEGRVLYRLHRARERNRLLVKKAKALAVQQHGRLFCCVCRFDFAARYGRVGEGFIECHHSKPLSELVGETVTMLSDLILVCSNCHRMIHRKRPWLTIRQLGKLLKK